MRVHTLTDGVTELDISLDFGPRVLRYGFAGGQNLFCEVPAGNDPAAFEARGGHRLWVAPEIIPGTYYPDNDPVEAEAIPNGVRVTAIPEAVGLQKQIEITMNGGRTVLVHRLWNRGQWPIEVSIWGLTMMAPGGLGIAGFPPRGRHPELLHPTHPLVMWAFTDLTDPRLKFTKKHVTLKQIPDAPEPNKIGLWNQHSWAAYILNGEMFVKRCTAFPGRKYPDHGASLEMWSNADTLELETLSPLEVIPPGGHIDHIEEWSLHRSISLAEISDEAIDAVMTSLPVRPV